MFIEDCNNQIRKAIKNLERKVEIQLKSTDKLDIPEILAQKALQEYAL